MGFTIMDSFMDKLRVRSSPGKGTTVTMHGAPSTENRPPMSEDIYLLLRMAQGGDKEAAGRLIEENSGLIWSIARRFFGRGVDRTTCISSAALAS